MLTKHDSFDTRTLKVGSLLLLTFVIGAFFTLPNRSAASASADAPQVCASSATIDRC